MYYQLAKAHNIEITTLGLQAVKARKRAQLAWSCMPFGLAMVISGITAWVLNADNDPGKNTASTIAILSGGGVIAGASIGISNRKLYHHKKSKAIELYNQNF